MACSALNERVIMGNTDKAAANRDCCSELNRSPIPFAHRQLCTRGSLLEHFHATPRTLKGRDGSQDRDANRQACAIA